MPTSIIYTKPLARWISLLALSASVEAIAAPQGASTSTQAHNLAQKSHYSLCPDIKLDELVSEAIANSKWRIVDTQGKHFLLSATGKTKELNNVEEAGSIGSSIEIQFIANADGGQVMLGNTYVNKMPAINMAAMDRLTRACKAIIKRNSPPEEKSEIDSLTMGMVMEWLGTTEQLRVINNNTKKIILKSGEPALLSSIFFGQDVVAKTVLVRYKIKEAKVLDYDIRANLDINNNGDTEVEIHSTTFDENENTHHKVTLANLDNWDADPIFSSEYTNNHENCGPDTKEPICKSGSIEWTYRKHPLFGIVLEESANIGTGPDPENIEYVETKRFFSFKNGKLMELSGLN